MADPVVQLAGSIPMVLDRRRRRSNGRPGQAGNLHQHGSRQVWIGLSLAVLQRRGRMVPSREPLHDGPWPVTTLPLQFFPGRARRNNSPTSRCLENCFMMEWAAENRSPPPALHGIADAWPSCRHLSLARTTEAARPHPTFHSNSGSSRAGSRNPPTTSDFRHPILLTSSSEL